MPDRAFRNRNLLDFLCAVAAVQDMPEAALGHATGLDPYGLDMAVGMALRLGFIHPVGKCRFIVTRQGVVWATGQLAHARALLALQDRAHRDEGPAIWSRAGRIIRVAARPPVIA
jgi:hypothetical protein